MKRVAILLVLAACGKPPAAPAPMPPAAGAVEKIKTITKGDAFSPSDYLVAGHVVILEFTADW